MRCGARPLFECIHLLVDHQLLDIERLDERGDGADDVGKDHRARKQCEDRKLALKVGAWSDVAVTDGGEGRHRPVERHDVLARDGAVDGGGLVCFDPRDLVVARELAREEPGAREKVRDEEELHDELQELQALEAGLEVVLERLNGLLDLEELEQADEAEDAKEAQHAECARVAARRQQQLDQLDGHRRRHIDPEPAAHVPADDRAVRRDPFALKQDGRVKGEDDIDDEDD